MLHLGIEMWSGGAEVRGPRLALRVLMDMRGMFANREAPHLQMNEHPASLRGADGSRADLHSLVVLEHNTYVCRGSNAGGSEKSGDDNMLNHSDLLIRCSHDSRRKATFRGRVITAIRSSDREGARVALQPSEVWFAASGG